MSSYALYNYTRTHVTAQTRGYVTQDKYLRPWPSEDASKHKFGNVNLHRQSCDDGQADLQVDASSTQVAKTHFSATLRAPVLRKQLPRLTCGGLRWVAS